jgi:hypothetical protein
METKNDDHEDDDQSDDLVSDLENDSDATENDKNKRVSCKSKVNFSKLSDQEKILRLQNMANLIKKLK